MQDFVDRGCTLCETVLSFDAVLFFGDSVVPIAYTASVTDSLVSKNNKYTYDL